MAVAYRLCTILVLIWTPALKRRLATRTGFLGNGFWWAGICQRRGAPDRAGDRTRFRRDPYGWGCCGCCSRNCSAV